MIKVSIVMPAYNEEKVILDSVRSLLQSDRTDFEVIVVDDGAATGATLRIALRVLRERGAMRLIVALPVAPVDVLEKLHALAEDVICLEIPSSFRAVGAHYRDFRQVDDQEVVLILEQANGACDHRLH